MISTLINHVQLCHPLGFPLIVVVVVVVIVVVVVVVVSSLSACDSESNSSHTLLIINDLFTATIFVSMGTIP